MTVCMTVNPDLAVYSSDIIYNEARHSVPGLYLLDKSEFKCKSRGMETCLHFRGAALNARETGI